MREPDSYTSDQAYLCWAQENKKRADRLYEAAITLMSVEGVGTPLLRELWDAAIDYEDRGDGG